ncbi:MAG: DUF3782 domain-containing protein [Desulfamplus sp.]|nr:DUF3782 domain-containing protein [Desulfamplus sp.]
MLDTMAIYEELHGAMDEAAARKIAGVIFMVFEELQKTVTKEEFRELTETVRGLSGSQKEMAQAQGRTEKRVEELAQAQGKTEKRVEELAQAQGKTEKRVEELAVRMEQGFNSLRDQIAALGGRWGIYNEGTFRNTIRTVLGKIHGVQVREGYYGDRQVDVIIRNGEHVLLEITSRMHPRDIEKIYRSADDYKAKEGIEPVLMVATSYISPRLMEKIMNLDRTIEIFSYEPED